MDEETGGRRAVPADELGVRGSALRRLLLMAVGTAIAYQLGYLFYIESAQVSAVWPATGLAIGLLLCSPRREHNALVAVMTTVSLTSSLVKTGQLGMSIGYVAANLLELVLAMVLVQRAAGGRVTLREVRQTAALIVAVAAGGALTASIAATTATLTSSASFAFTHRVWWTSEALGILLVTPLVVSWHPANRIAMPRGRLAEAALFLAVWIPGCWLVFWLGPLGADFVAPHPYLLLALVPWAALRLELRWVTLALAWLAIVSLGTVVEHGGVFPLEGDTLAQRLFAVQFYLAIVGTSGLLLAASRAETQTASQAWEEERARLVALGDNLPDSVVYQVVADADGQNRFVHVSANADRVLGLRAADVLADPNRAYSGVAPEDLVRMREIQRGAAAALEVFRAEIRFEKPTGERRWLVFSASPRRLPDGRLLWDGIAADVTDHHLAREELERANRALRTRSECSHALARAEGEDELLRRVCEITREHGGYCSVYVALVDEAEPERLRLGAFSGAHAPATPLGREDTALITQAMQRRADASTVRGRFAEHSPSVDASHARARVVAVSLRDEPRCLGALVICGADRDPVADPDARELLHGIADDLAFGIKARRAEAALEQVAAEMKRERQRSEAVLRSAMDGIVTVDEAGRIVMFNPAAERMFRCKAEAALGRSLETFLPWRSLRRAPDAGDGTATTSSDRFGEVEGHRGDGESFPLEASVSSVEVDRARLFTVTCRDLTERRAAEQHLREVEHRFRQVQKMEAFGQLAGGVAHDFNNFLMAIMMQAELAERVPDLPTRARESLEGILESASRASDLTRQLLMFSRKQVLQFRALDLNQVVANMGKMLERVLPENVGQTLRLHERPLTVKADAGMLDQVLLNLAVNARDAMPDGGHLVIATEERRISAPETHNGVLLAPGTYACLRVSDSGSGIDQDVLPRIFEPFFTTKEAGKGTGLGLATVFGIAQQHGGSVRVSSEIGGGTTFEVLLPRVDSAPDGVASFRPSPTERSGNETLLLVEDDARVRAATTSALEASGYRVLAAADGDEALALWSQRGQGIDLLLTDLVMPTAMSGRELADRLMAERAGLRVILFSGYAADMAGTELRLDARQRFLQKPCSMQQLLDAVRSCLDGTR